MGANRNRSLYTDTPLRHHSFGTQKRSSNASEALTQRINTHINWSLYFTRFFLCFLCFCGSSRSIWSSFRLFSMIRECKRTTERSICSTFFTNSHRKGVNVSTFHIKYIQKEKSFLLANIIFLLTTRQGGCEQSIEQQCYNRLIVGYTVSRKNRLLYSWWHGRRWRFLGVPGLGGRCQEVIWNQ